MKKLKGTVFLDFQVLHLNSGLLPHEHIVQAIVVNFHHPILEHVCFIALQ